MELGIPNIEIEMKIKVDYDEQTYANFLYQIDGQIPRILGFASCILN